MNRDHSVIFEIAPKYYISASFVDYDGYSMSLRDSSPQQQIQWSYELHLPILVHFSLLIPKMLLFTCHLLFDHFQFTLIHGSNIPGSYAILLFTASDFTSITSHIHHWVLFLLCIFIYPGVISSLISSSILGTYRPREFIFQCPIILPFHTWGSQGKNTEMVCHSLLQWTTFCQNFPQ